MRTILGFILLLWAQVFVALIPTWRDGEYYAYGWFVPPLALLLAWRRWEFLREFRTHGDSQGSLEVSTVLLAIFALLALAPLRLIETADPGWRPPLLTHAAIVVVLSHGFLWKTHGRRISLRMLPVTIFALSAVPYPWQLERALIRELTGNVMSITRECFLLAGKPVELVGEQLAIGNDVVEVTDGCSGIRSLQSLVMVSLLFGEWFLLGFWQRLLLIMVATFGALATNTVRAFWLADLHFTRGPEAAAAAHDQVGHLAFIVSAGLLWISAFLLLRRNRPDQIEIRRIHVASNG